MKFPTFSYPSTTQQGQEERRKAAEAIRIRGADIQCKPPRSVTCQGGSRKLVTTWEPPADTKGIVGWNVYTPDEGTFYQRMDGISNRRCDVNVSTGTTPSATAVFVSSIGASDKNESTKTQGIGTPTAETGAPSDPTPPAGSTGGSDIPRNQKQARLLYGN